MRLYVVGATPSSATVTAADGTYLFTNRAPGDYELWFRDLSGQWFSEYHDDVATRAEATAVTLTAGGSVTVDADLAARSGPTAPAIGGQVTSTLDGTPIQGIQVRAYPAGGGNSSATFTDANGNYTLTRPAGDYKLWFRDIGGQTWISEYHQDQATLAAADIVTLGTTNVTVNAALDPVGGGDPTYGTISGTVTSTVDDTPIQGIQVRLYPAGGGNSSATFTDENGHYTFTNRAEGDYYLWFRDIGGQTWISEYHENQASLAEADAITLADTGLVIDAALDPVDTIGVF